MLTGLDHYSYHSYLDASYFFELVVYKTQGFAHVCLFLASSAGYTGLYLSQDILFLKTDALKYSRQTFFGLQETLPNSDIPMIHIMGSLVILYMLIDFSALISRECSEFSGFCYSPFLKGQAVLKLNWGEKIKLLSMTKCQGIQLQDLEQSCR